LGRDNGRTVLSNHVESNEGAGRWLVEYPRGVPVAIFLFVLAITFSSVLVIERSDSQRELSRMRETSQAIASAVERRAASSGSYLRAGAALLATSDKVDPDVFREFVDELRLDSDFQGSEGIGWAEAISSDEIDAFEARMSSEGFPGVNVRPAGQAPSGRMVPVTFLQPETERNLRAIGYDMYSERVRRAAMDEALRTISPTASGRVVLVQEGEGASPGFLIYMPVLDGDGVRRRLRGFVYSPFNAQIFLESALQLESRGGMGVKLYDGAIVPDRLMAQVPAERATGRTVIEDVELANRPMLLVIESSDSAALSLVSMLTLLFGLAVASLLMLIARLMTRQATEDQASLDWLAEQHSIRNTLTRELNHRVKNTLANVLSIVSLTRRRSDSLDEFADQLEGRIRALSSTHDLLAESEWGTTPVAAVVEAELAPYSSDRAALIEREGPDVEIAPNDALSLGLALHELATNATKYGALSGTPGGKVSIRWRVLPDDLVELVWTEVGGPEVAKVRKRGFGTELIEKIVAHELRHPVQLDFAPEGVTCRLLVPLRSPAPFKMRAASPSGEA